MAKLPEMTKHRGIPSGLPGTGVPVHHPPGQSARRHRDHQPAAHGRPDADGKTRRRGVLACAVAPVRRRAVRTRQSRRRPHQLAVRAAKSSPPNSPSTRNPTRRCFGSTNTWHGRATRRRLRMCWRCEGAPEVSPAARGSPFSPSSSSGLSRGSTGGRGGRRRHRRREARVPAAKAPPPPPSSSGLSRGSTGGRGKTGAKAPGTVDPRDKPEDDGGESDDDGGHDKPGNHDAGHECKATRVSTTTKPAMTIRGTGVPEAPPSPPSSSGLSRGSTGGRGDTGARGAGHCRSSGQARG